MEEARDTRLAEESGFEPLDPDIVRWIHDARAGAGTRSPVLKLRAAEARFIWEWLIHEDNLLTNRGNFFLVAQSMMLAAYATLVAPERVPLERMATVVAVAGMAISIIWLFVTQWSLKKTFWKLRALARAAIPVYDEICEARRTRFGAHRLIGAALPWLIALIWASLITISVVDR